MALRIEDRITAFALFVIGSLTILLGLFNVRHNIKATFFGDLGASSVSLTNSEQSQLNALHNKDTDTDGLSDYDELYSFNTSPYLADSDSDGKTDKQEIDAGTNPNCSGADCSQSRTGNTTTPTTQTAVNTGSMETSNTSTGTGTVAGLGSNPTADQIREVLLNAGVSQDILDKTDDASLRDIYAQTLAQAGTTNGSTNQNTAIDANYADLLQNQSPTTQDLTQFSPTQIRDLLAKAGVGQNILAKIKDEDLLVIYEQALQEANTGATTTP